MLEATQAPIKFEELIKKVCDKDQYIKTYIGEDLKVRDNKKLRTILEMMLQNSHVKRISVKPVVLQWTSKEIQKEEIFDTKDSRCDPCDLCDQQNEIPMDQSQSAFPEKTLKSQGAESKVNKEGLVTESMTPEVIGSQRAHRSHSEYDFELVAKSVLEIPMGLTKDWSIKRIGKNGDVWSCDYPGCSDNNGGNVITGSIGAIKAHALNHETVEIQEKLERLNDLNLGSLLEELEKCSRGMLQKLQNRVEHGSTLEQFILEALDVLEESKSSTR
jgi:hypothetical protein